jgi:hypothetical protein
MKVNMISFPKINVNGLWILLLILFLALAVSILFPMYYGIHEGLTAAELDSSGKIRSSLQTYTNTVETNCQDAVNKISTAPDLSQTDSIALTPIVSNTNFTSTAKLQQIIAFKSSTPGIIDAINTVQGKNYTALLKLLQSIPSDTSDTEFNRILNTQIGNVNNILNNTNSQSPYYLINTYVKNAIPSS